MLVFVDKNGKPIDSVDSLTSWRPRCTGEWDGIMHIEVKDPRGRWHRRQCREFFYIPPTKNRVHLRYTNIRRTGQIQVAFAERDIQSAELRESSRELNLLQQDAKKMLKANLDSVVGEDANQLGDKQQRIATLVDALFSREGDNAYGKLRNYDAQTAQEQVAFAENNGLNVDEAEVDFARQFNQRAALEGNKFTTFESFGTGYHTEESFYSIFGLSASYDTTRRYTKAKVTHSVDGDIEYWVYGAGSRERALNSDYTITKLEKRKESLIQTGKIE